MSEPRKNWLYINIGKMLYLHTGSLKAAEISAAAMALLDEGKKAVTVQILGTATVCKFETFLRLFQEPLLRFENAEAFLKTFKFKANPKILRSIKDLAAWAHPRVVANLS